MQLKLVRYFQNSHVTLGVLRANIAHIPIYTLELPWRDNQKEISCIPPGKYKLCSYSSAEYPNTWEVMNVPGRSKILIHIGNYPKDTLGCILPGLGVVPEQPMVNNSGKAIELLRALLGKGIHDLEIFNL